MAVQWILSSSHWCMVFCLTGIGFGDSLILLEKGLYGDMDKLWGGCCPGFDLASRSVV